MSVVKYIGTCNRCSRRWDMGQVETEHPCMFPHSKTLGEWMKEIDRVFTVQLKTECPEPCLHWCYHLPVESQPCEVCQKIAKERGMVAVPFNG